MAGQRTLQLKFLAEPSNVNFGGKVHGGSVMKWIDQAGYAAAVGWSGRYCVTVAVGGIRFLAPVRIGDLVSVTATIARTGTSSMQISVDVRARDPMGGEERLCTHCIIVFVALDGVEGKTVEVPKWLPESEDDRAMGVEAERVMQAVRALSDD